MTIALFLVTVLIWGTTFFAISLQLGEVSPLQSVFYRFALAALIMWAIAAAARRRIRYPWRDHLLFGTLGLLLFSLNYVTVYYATRYLFSGLVSIIFSLLVLFNTLSFWLYFKERPSISLIAGGILGGLGISALFFEDLTAASVNAEMILGLCLVLVSTVSVSGGNIVARVLQLRNIDVVTSNTWSMSYGSMYLLLAVLIEGEPWRFTLDSGYVLSFLYLSIVGTVIAFWTYLTLIHRIGGPRAAYITVLFPLVALLISTLYEDLQWSFYKALGVILILAGNVFIIQRKS